MARIKGSFYFVDPTRKILQSMVGADVAVMGRRIETATICYRNFSRHCARCKHDQHFRFARFHDSDRPIGIVGNRSSRESDFGGDMQTTNPLERACTFHYFLPMHEVARSTIAQKLGPKAEVEIEVTETANLTVDEFVQCLRFFQAGNLDLDPRFDHAVCVNSEPWTSVKVIVESVGPRDPQFPDRKIPFLTVEGHPIEEFHAGISDIGRYCFTK